MPGCRQECDAPSGDVLTSRTALLQSTSTLPPHCPDAPTGVRANAAYRLQFTLTPNAPSSTRTPTPPTVHSTVSGISVDALRVIRIASSSISTIVTPW